MTSRALLGLLVLPIAGIFAAACGGATDTGIGTSSSSSSSSSSGSSGASSSSSSSSSSSGSTSSSGGLTYTTTCSPAVGDHFFDGAKPIGANATRTVAPCSAGMHALPKDTVILADGPLPSPVRFTKASDFDNAYCTTGDTGTNGQAIDFTTQDVIAVPFRGVSPTPPTAFDVAGDVWMRTDESQCGEAPTAHPTNQLGFFVVTKGQKLSLETCVTTCSCIGENCGFAPGEG